MRKMRSTLSPRELINPKSTLTGNARAARDEALVPAVGKIRGWLREWILKGHADDWKTMYTDNANHGSMRGFSHEQ
jgi:methionyl-tRNA synthetase